MMYPRLLFIALFYSVMLLTAVLFLLPDSNAFFLILLLCCIFSLLCLLLVVATYTTSNFFPLIHSAHVLSISLALLYLMLHFSCPFLNSISASPTSKTAYFPSASVHPSLNGIYSSFLATLRSQRRSFVLSFNLRSSRKRFALFIFFSLLLSGDVELNPGPSLPNNLSFATLNIRSASSITSDLDKPEVLRDFILTNSLDVLLLTETWLSSDSPPSVLNSLTPLGYSLIHKPRSTGRGGGLAVIYRSCLSISEVSLSFVSSFESLYFTLTFPTKTFSFLGVYRSPSCSLSDFLGDFPVLLSDLCSKSSHLIISGDFNVHVDDLNSFGTRCFLDTLQSFDLKQLVDFSTHDSGHTLDLLISTTTAVPLFSNIHSYFPALSDHDAVIASISVPVRIRSPRTTKIIRPFRSIDPTALSADILSSSLYSSPPTNLSDYLTEFNSVLSSLVDKHAPPRTVTCSSSHKPFSSPEIKVAKAKRSRLETIYRRSRSPADLANFKQQSKLLSKLITSAKREYYRKQISSNTKNPRKLWTTLNSLLNRSSEPKLPSSISLSNLPLAFLNTFADKITQLRSTITSSLSSPHIAPDIPPPLLCNFSPTSNDEIRSLILSSPDSSCSLDVIPTWLLKSCLDSLLPPITTLLNLCLSESTFPSPFKHALVTPLLKKFNLPYDNLANYRPISNLSFLSKLLERLILKRLLQHLTSFSSIPIFQSGFRKSYSTETALLRIHNDLLLAMENKRVSALILLDLSAAFDTVDHSILLSRLSLNFGVTSSALSLLNSYLSDRTQSVHIGSHSSPSSHLLTGVPQGSVLGPLLFTLYTTPLSYLLNNSGVSYHIYADDTQLYYSFSACDSHSTLTYLSNVLESVHDWLSSNYLSLNPSKTEFLLIGTDQQRSKIASDLLSFSGSAISPSDSARNLGVIFDSDLSLSKQISSVCRRSYHSIRLLRQIRSSLDLNSAVLLANSLTSSNLDYCNSLYYSLPNSSLHRLQLVQNSLARAVLRLKSRDHISPALHSLHWLPIHKRIEFKICLLTYKSLHNSAPSYLSNFLKPYVPSRRLRSSDASLLTIPFVKSCSGRRSFSFSAPTLWNSLPLRVRLSPTLLSFRASLKTFLYPP